MSQLSDTARRILHAVCDAITQETGGMNVGGVQVVGPIIRTHLEGAGVPNTRINYLLDRTDRQDTRRPLTLLTTLRSPPDAPPTSTPEFRHTRYILRIVGSLGEWGDGVEGPTLQLDSLNDDVVQHIFARIRAMH
ncbi:hypothetical protein C8R46DRAFT_1186929 [Mycena filopes]|nr:hypothetical protein C8R46DRAFT_1186929 [Mycena filopes]